MLERAVYRAGLGQDHQYRDCPAHGTVSGEIERNLGLSGCSEIGVTCLMLGKCSPNLESGGKTIDWVICDMRQSWYHSDWTPS